MIDKVNLVKYANDNNIPYRTVVYRDKHNIPLDGRKPRQFTIQGESHTVKEWEELCGCRWQNIKERAKRGVDVKKTKKIPYKGRMVTYAELSRESGVVRETLVFRFKNGLRDDDLTKKPILSWTFEGQTHTIKEWAKIYDVSKDMMYKRKRRGLNPDGTKVTK